MNNSFDDFHSSVFSLILYLCWTVLIVIGDIALVICFIGSNECEPISFSLSLLIMTICVSICILNLIGMNIGVFLLLYLWFYDWVKRRNNGK